MCTYHQIYLMFGGSPCMNLLHFSLCIKIETYTLYNSIPFFQAIFGFTWLYANARNMSKECLHLKERLITVNNNGQTKIFKFAHIKYFADIILAILSTSVFCYSRESDFNFIVNNLGWNIIISTVLKFIILSSGVLSCANLLIFQILMLYSLSHTKNQTEILNLLVEKLPLGLDLSDPNVNQEIRKRLHICLQQDLNIRG